MSQSDSDDDDEFDEQSQDADGDDDADIAEIDEDLLDAVEAATSTGGTDAEDGEFSEEEEEQSEDAEDEEDEDEGEGASQQSSQPAQPSPVVPVTTAAVPIRSSPPRDVRVPRTPSPEVRQRSLSPAGIRRAAILTTLVHPKSYTVEAICAIPHPVPTHALAASLCMTHLLTGSDDGYVRDYDIFAAVNGKTFLTAQQRHHCGVIEGTMKSGQIRCWWENPGLPRTAADGPDDIPPAPVYSMAMQGDALWSLAGTKGGHINLTTVRHDPGRTFHTFVMHRGPVSALSLQHDEKGFFSAGWDGVALQWDLNTGQIVRSFTAHGAQLVAVAVRPLAPPSVATSPSPGHTPATVHLGAAASQVAAGSPMVVSPAAPAASADQPPKPDDSDARSEASYDPLFDDEPDADGALDSEGRLQFPPNPPTASTTPTAFELAMPSSTPGPFWQQPSAAPTPTPPTPQPSKPQPGRPAPSTVQLAPHMPPLLDASNSPDFSPDLLMTASIDGQVVLWDRRVSAYGSGDTAQGVGRLWMNEKTPPWCVSACWSATGMQLYAGRRPGTIDVWDVRQLGRSGPNSSPRLLKTIRNPAISRAVSCVVAFPDGKHLACASSDNIRLWNVANAGEPGRSGAQFKIIPGHHGGFVSQMLVDPAARFLVSASSDRGWNGESSKTVFVHDIKHLF